MKAMRILLVAMLAMLFGAENAKAEGYWKKQGQVKFEYGPGKNMAREWPGQNKSKVQLLDYGPSHFTMKVIFMVNKQLQTTIYRTEFNTPTFIVPGKVVDASTSAIAIEMNPLNTWHIDVAGCSWEGGVPLVTGYQNFKGALVGEKVEGKRNLDRRIGPGVAGATGKIKCSITPTAWSAVAAYIPYVWVVGTPPSGGTVAPQTPPRQTPPATKSARDSGRVTQGMTMWVDSSKPSHYFKREATSSGIRWIEYSDGKAWFEFEEKSVSIPDNSVTLFDPSRNITGYLYPDRFEWGIGGRKSGTRPGGWQK